MASKVKQASFDILEILKKNKIVSDTDIMRHLINKYGYFNIFDSISILRRDYNIIIGTITEKHSENKYNVNKYVLLKDAFGSIYFENNIADTLAKLNKNNGFSKKKIWQVEHCEDYYCFKYNTYLKNIKYYLE